MKKNGILSRKNEAIFVDMMINLKISFQL